ncbi:putative N-acetyltransferase [Trypanosoma grayi]|uniref:putative N-acetyltransferase n=1 Tax=Trypanosoma grayi TaxID=71804 RepID=UPI0004F45CA8|nr:putative N-acetyltransferase [Trypanosoma grayi]KEG07977.1 putative N-acetyltransferase [Trypanosoma grayi]
MNNEHVLVCGSRLRLVPFLAQHVPRYHQWMCDPELLQFTASEPLTLEEEYENQREWLCAEDKLTFILLAPLTMILDKQTIEEVLADSSEKDVDESISFLCDDGDDDVGGDKIDDADGVEQKVDEGEEKCSGSLALQRGHICTPRLALCPTSSGSPYSPGSLHREEEHRINTTYVMVGDCNLFRLGSSEAEGASSEEGRCFEVEVMIADRAFRRHGIGEEAVRLLMSYAMDRLGASCFIAKIIATNTPSIQLFTTKLGFCVLKEVSVFNEVHYCRRFDGAAEMGAWRSAANYRVGVYDDAVEQEMIVLHSLPNTDAA